MDKRAGSECIICFFDIYNSSSYSRCSTCGINIHTKCYVKWLSHNNSEKNDCIYCQSNNSMDNYNLTTRSKCFKYLKRAFNYIICSK